MKILIVGSKNSIYRSLFNKLIANGHEVFKTVRDREQDDLHFDIDKVTSWKSFKNVDLIIYTSWKMNPRSKLVATKNVMAAKAILEFNRDIPLIFISSMSANPESVSEYGRAKYEVEKAFLKHNKYVIKPGILYDPVSNIILGTVGKTIAYLDKFFFLILFNPDFRIFISSIDVVSDSILDIVEGHVPTKNIVEEISFNSFLIRFLSHKIIKITISIKIVDLILNLFYLLNKKINDINDSWKSISKDATMSYLNDDK